MALSSWGKLNSTSNRRKIEFNRQFQNDPDQRKKVESILKENITVFDKDDEDGLEKSKFEELVTSEKNHSNFGLFWYILFRKFYFI